MKRANPDTLVYTYQGTAIWPPSAWRRPCPPPTGENITVIFVNNGIYGMTGGQMAPPPWWA